MNPIVHAELAWLSAQGLSARRDRILVTVAGLVPDLDGLTILAGEESYGKWHHVLTHGSASAVVLSGLLAVFAQRKALTFALAFAMFHLHLACDFVGSGPGWGMTYLWPFSEAYVIWDGQWDLASWQNGVIGALATAAVLGCAVWKGRTIVELFSTKADAQVVATVRRRLRATSPGVSGERSPRSGG